MSNAARCSGVGLGLRRDLVDSLIEAETGAVSFVELAPENWMGIGGFWKKKLDAVSERYPMTCHGLSLSLGSSNELDWDFLKRIKKFLADARVSLFSEHLSYSKCGNAHLYDLLPLPFREDALKHVVKRIGEVQDFLGRRIAVENISYYTPVLPEMDEATFLTEVIKESKCGLLLDINNVYVNSENHKYDPKKFLSSLPHESVMGVHMAGHERREDIIIDTHGAPISDPVFDLFTWIAPSIPQVPVLLERDFNFPDFDELLGEIGRLGWIINNAWNTQYAA